MSLARHAARSIGAAGLALAAMACADGAASPPAATYAESFDAMWATFDREYAYFGVKGVDWNEVRRSGGRRAARVTSDAEFLALVRATLAPLRDVHVGIMDRNGAMSATWHANRAENWSPAADASLRRDGEWREERAAFGHRTVGGVPYLQVAGWNRDEFSVADFDRVLARYRQAPALVIDVRRNAGGSDAVAYAVAARFTRGARTAGYVRVRSGPRHGDFTPLTPRVVTPRGAWGYDGRVLLLAGRGSWSATESFVSAMRELPNVTVVGDTTGGGSGNPAVFPLRGGWGVTVSRWMEYTADRRLIEGVGIPPDIAVPFSRAALDAGRDETLAMAIALATRGSASAPATRAGKGVGES